MSDSDSRRERIKSKIAASQARLRRDGNEPDRLPALPDAAPPEKISGLAAEYPGLVVAGGLALGLLAGSLLPRSAGQKLSRRGAALAGIVAELGMVYGKQALERAGEAGREGREKLGELGESLGDRTAGARRRAETAGISARTLGLSLAKKAVELVANAKR